MKKLHSLAPSQLPHLSVLIDALTNRHPEAIGRHLGVSAHTVRRWIKAEQAPRAAMLALFWETRWGLGMLDAEAVNLVRTHIGLNKALVRENETLRRRIERLEALSYGAANAPTFSTLIFDHRPKPFLAKA